MATVEVTGPRKSFGPVDVVQGVSIDIADGEFGISVLVDIGGTEATCVVNDRVDFAPGQPVRVSIASPNIHLFDAANEQRLDHALVDLAGAA